MARAPDFSVPETVLGAFVRIATNPRVFRDPTPVDVALRACDEIRNSPRWVRVEPGPGHWGTFARLCRDARARGDLVMDAWLAAIAIEHGAEWVTLDRDFARFPGLRWTHPD